MEIKYFNALPTKFLNNKDAVALMKSTVDTSKLYKDKMGEIAALALDYLESQTNLFGQVMNNPKKSTKTDVLTTNKKDIDSRFSEIKRNVTVHVKGRNAEKKNAAEGLKVFLTPFWEMNTEAMNTRTNIMFDMYAKYNASNALKQQAQIIGVGTMFAELEVANKNFDVLYKSRSAENKGNNIGMSSTELKPSAVASYVFFCTTIETVVSCKPTPELLVLFNSLNDLRKKYHILLKQSKGGDTSADQNMDSATK